MLSLLAAVMLLADEAPTPPPPPPPSVAADPLPAQPPPVDLGLTGYDAKSRSWLRVELSQLQAKKPNLVPQILVLVTSLCLGGVASVAALRPGESAGGFFAATAVGSLVIATVSAIFLYLGLRERSDVDEKIAAVEKALNRDRDTDFSPPPGGVPPPPPPPPSPGGASLAPSGALRLARF